MSSIELYGSRGLGCLTCCSSDFSSSPTVLSSPPLRDDGLRVSRDTHDRCLAGGRFLSSLSVGLSSHQAELGYVARSPGGYLPLHPSFQRRAPARDAGLCALSPLRSLTDVLSLTPPSTCHPGRPSPPHNAVLSKVTSSPLLCAAHPGRAVVSRRRCTSPSNGRTGVWLG